MTYSYMHLKKITTGFMGSCGIFILLCTMELCYISKSKQTINLIASDTTCIVSMKMHSHFTEIYDFERGYFAEVVAYPSSQVTVTFVYFFFFFFEIIPVSLN